jgi:hypothetical protein
VTGNTSLLEQRTNVAGEVRHSRSLEYCGHDARGE